MMYVELYQYLLLHNKLSVPGIGTFLLEKRSAQIDFTNKQIIPPAYSITFQSKNETPPAKFFAWLGDLFGISDRDAVIRFNDFAFGMKQQIANGDIINWNGIGSLSKGSDSEIKFSEDAIQSLQTAVTAHKVIREKAEHMVRVGEDQKTSVEMEAMLNQSPLIRSYWWITGLVLLILSIGFIGWHFYQNGFEPSSAANCKALDPMTAGNGYEVLQ